MSGVIFDRQNWRESMLLASQEARDAAKHPVVYSDKPNIETQYSAQNSNTAKVEKPCFLPNIFPGKYTD